MYFLLPYFMMMVVASSSVSEFGIFRCLETDIFTFSSFHKYGLVIHVCKCQSLNDKYFPCNYIMYITYF